MSFNGIKIDNRTLTLEENKEINSLIRICSQQTTPKDKTEEWITVRNGG